MCFVFILTENKWYIFFKKEIKRHTEKVCGIAKRTNKQKPDRTSDGAKTSRLVKENSKRESSDLEISITTSSAPPRNLCSDHTSSKTPTERSNRQWPWKEYCLIAHQLFLFFFAHVDWISSSFFFPLVIYWFQLHIRTHLLNECICVVDVAIENTHMGRLCLVALIGYGLFFSFHFYLFFSSIIGLVAVFFKCMPILDLDSFRSNQTVFDCVCKSLW